ncbi:hypothetical protein L9F63_020688, partial [Diploptera punctata]
TSIVSLTWSDDSPAIRLAVAITKSTCCCSAVPVESAPAASPVSSDSEEPITLRPELPG